MRTYETPTKFAAPFLVILAIGSAIICIIAKEHFIVNVSLSGFFLWWASCAHKTRKRHKMLDASISKN